MEELGDISSKTSSPIQLSKSCEEIIMVSDEKNPSKKAVTPAPKAESQATDQEGSSSVSSGVHQRRKLKNAQFIPSSQPGTSTARRELSPVPARESSKLVLRLDPPPQCCY